MSEIELATGLAQDASHATVPAVPDPVPFFLVGTWKLVVLCVTTLGLYEFYWFYRHWRQLQRFGGEDVWPAARAVFAGLFSYTFFVRVNEEAEAQGASTVVSPALLAGTYFVALFSARLGASPWLVIGLSIVPLALAQAVVNRLPHVQALPPVQRNERLSKKNWASVATFGLLVILLMLPEPGPASTSDVSIPALAEAMNQDLPQPMTGGVMLDRVEWAMDGIGLYVRIVHLDEKELRTSDVLDGVRGRLLQMACAASGLEGVALDRGIRLRYSIADKAGSRVGVMELTSRAQCGAGVLPGGQSTPSRVF
jgi:hypothetical protein